MDWDCRVRDGGNCDPGRCCCVCDRFHAGDSCSHVGWTLWKLYFLKPDGLETAAVGYDAVVEGNAGTAAAEFAHYESGSRCARDVETVAVAFWGEEDVVVSGGVDGLEKSGIERYLRSSCVQAR